LEERWTPTTVTNLLDSGPGSLRQAILDTPAGGTVDFQPGLSGTITLTTGELAINKDLTISGPGASVIMVSGNHASRVFDIAATFTMSLSGLTIADGSVSGQAFGGGISNSGTLTVTNCALNGNTSATLEGGGIYNAGTLTVSGSTFSGNFGAGGGIFNGGQLTVTDSVLSGNSTGTFSLGGGIYNAGTLPVSGSTLSGNSAGSGGGIFNFSSGTTPPQTVPVAASTSWAAR
jgi:hypothetical protein